MNLYSSNIIESNNSKQTVDQVLAYFNINSTENNPDILFLNPPKGKFKIPIEEVKKVKEWINLKPYQEKNKILIIENAEMLGVDSQNALLKTLEEPPIYSIIVLITPSVKSLLDTVVSRCKVIKLSEINSTLVEGKISLLDIIDNSLGESLDKIEQISKEIESKDDVINILNNMEFEISSNIQSLNPKFFSVIQQIKTDVLNTNVSTKIALYKLVLDLKS